MGPERLRSLFCSTTPTSHGGLFGDEKGQKAVKGRQFVQPRNRKSKNQNQKKTISAANNSIKNQK